MLPSDFQKDENRSKPWGTGHAMLCVKDAVDGPFAIINADDFYGRDAMEAVRYCEEIYKNKVKG